MLEFNGTRTNLSGQPLKPWLNEFKLPSINVRQNLLKQKTKVDEIGTAGVDRPFLRYVGHILYLGFFLNLKGHASR